MKFNSYDALVNLSKEAQKKWRLLPAPKRGEIIREFGNELRNQKANLAKVITKEARKIVSEAEEAKYIEVRRKALDAQLETSKHFENPGSNC